MMEDPSRKKPQQGRIEGWVGCAPSFSDPLCKLFQIGGEGDQFGALFRPECIFADRPLAEEASKRKHLVVVEFGCKVVSVTSCVSSGGSRRIEGLGKLLLRVGEITASRCPWANAATARFHR